MRYFVLTGGREIVVDVDGHRVEVDGRVFEAHLSPVPGTPLRHLLMDGASLTLAMERRGPGSWQVAAAGTQLEMEVLDERTRHIRSLTGAAEAARAPTALKAPMPGLVVRVLVAPGQAVAPGQGLVVLEAMKMENELRSATDGIVRTVQVTAGQAVEKGQLLVEFEK